MTSVAIKPLRDDLPFGSLVHGLTRENVEDEAVRSELRQALEDRALLIFKDMEPSNPMQVALSTVFGPLKEHPVKAVDLVDSETMAGTIENALDPETSDIVEIEGKLYSNWLPWHFDHCYNNELNRAGVLRITEIAPNGGLTAFMDGIDLYRNLSPELLEQIEGRSVIYTMDMQFDHMRFGKPKGFRLVQLDPHMIDIYEQSKTYPRAIHPAVWTRKTGEKVFHFSPWMAEGIEGQETPAGDELLEAISQEIYRLGETRAYYHHWELTDMVIWDNWRILHRVTGSHPPHRRTVQRTTIKGDYGLGRFENSDQGRCAALERTV